ncbi:hypothetical protein F971_01876 [Acinetobacter vivianii]|uniref:Lipoprotein n=1 Tax=Acinetobacter vivianii TaxID=1776742 RepID=N8WD49_9GAMM|nr:hypothetical protein [Acinetobacter vivianii]ENU92889.1 hypothetical protein F971_01876 [Acinetobacter vivianii]
MSYLKFFIFSIVFLLSACTRQTVYLVPSAEGYLYNAITKEPLRNLEGYASYTSGNDTYNFVKTNNVGKFKTKPIIYTYRISKPDYRNWNQSLIIFIDFPNYEPVIFQIDEFVQDQNAINPNKETTVNIGKVYLNPK